VWPQVRPARLRQQTFPTLAAQVLRAAPPRQRCRRCSQSRPLTRQHLCQTVSSSVSVKIPRAREALLGGQSLSRANTPHKRKSPWACSPQGLTRYRDVTTASNLCAFGLRPAQTRIQAHGNAVPPCFCRVGGNTLQHVPPAFRPFASRPGRSTARLNSPLDVPNPVTAPESAEQCQFAFEALKLRANSTPFFTAFSFSGTRFLRLMTLGRVRRTVSTSTTPV